MTRLLLLAALLAGCAAASAQERAAPVCQAEVPPPAEFAAWSAARPLVSATAAGGLGGVAFDAGTAAELRLHPDGEVTYLTLPKSAGEAASFGGLARVHIARAGLYKVGVGAPAWVDMTRDGKPTATAAFGRGPDCTAIKKVVSFRLEAGDYTLEISGSKAPVLRVIVVPG